VQPSGSQHCKPRSGLWYEDLWNGTRPWRSWKGSRADKSRSLYLVRDPSFLAGRSTFQMSPYRLRPAWLCLIRRVTSAQQKWYHRCPISYTVAYDPSTGSASWKCNGRRRAMLRDTKSRRAIQPGRLDNHACKRQLERLERGELAWMALRNLTRLIIECKIATR
jgi:hypothetical protein